MSLEELRDSASRVAATLLRKRIPFDYYFSGTSQEWRRHEPQAWRVTSLPIAFKAVSTNWNWKCIQRQDEEIWLQPSGELFVLECASSATSDGGPFEITCLPGPLTPAVARRPDRERIPLVDSDGNGTLDERSFRYASPFDGLRRSLEMVADGRPCTGHASVGVLGRITDMSGDGTPTPPPDSGRHPSLVGAFQQLQLDAAALARNLVAQKRPYNSYSSTQPVAVTTGGIFGLFQRSETSYETVPVHVPGWRVNSINEGARMMRSEKDGWNDSHYKQDDIEVWLLADGALVEIAFTTTRSGNGPRSVSAHSGPLQIATALRSDKVRTIRTSREKRGDTIREYEWFDETETLHGTPFAGIGLELARLRDGATR